MNFYTQKFVTQIWQIVSERINFVTLVIIAKLLFNVEIICC